MTLGLALGDTWGPFQSTPFHDSVGFSVRVGMDADSPKGGSAGWVLQVRNPSAYCTVILFLKRGLCKVISDFNLIFISGEEWTWVQKVQSNSCLGLSGLSIPGKYHYWKGYHHDEMRIWISEEPKHSFPDACSHLKSETPRIKRSSGVICSNLEIKHATLICALPQDTALVLKTRCDFSKLTFYAQTENKTGNPKLLS